MKSERMTPGRAVAMVEAEHAFGARCDCGHLRTSHAGATRRNNGGNDCAFCDCPLYMAERPVQP